MKLITTIFLISFFLIAFGQSENLSFQTRSFAVSLNTEGNLTSIRDKLNGKEYVVENQSSPILSISSNGNIENPTSARLKGKIIILEYAQNDLEARITVAEKEEYLTFELTEISPADKVELVIWGPYQTKIKETVGESVGVVRNKEFAIGIQALNVKTLGGYPDNESDIEPAYDIFSTDNLIDVDESVKILYRGQTAKHTDFGSVLQAYCRNRNEERIISNWGHTHYVAPAYEDGGVVGSKIALFGCPAEKALDVIAQIELNEGLPHPLIDGEWAKKSSKATASYLIIGFGEENLDQAIELTKKAGLEYLYHGGPFETWGHFKLNEKAFPDNWESMMRCVQRAEEKGIKLGVHTLSNFITTNDPYVTPVPDKRLAKVGQSVLAKEISSTDDEIFIESPVFFNQMENNSLHSVVIGNEIIRYREVSKEKPWKLTGCVRGAFNTKTASHKKGAKIEKLMDHGYKVFLSNAELSAEIAETIARFFNETGLKQVSFDGLEGVWSTGMGQYARSLFTKTWYDHLSEDLKGKVINDASNPSHFNWHINTRYNWGEPWYAGFRESQTMYRLMNQDFYRRNLLPSMLGWFSMNSQTSVEDAEWLLARAAGFDAGFAFNVSFDTFQKNGQSEAIFNAIKTWETARMAGAFSSDQKKRMEDINKEFHLEQTGPDTWNLFPLNVEQFVFKQKVRQPGEPLHSIFEFNNPYREQSLVFSAVLLPEQNAPGANVTKIVLEINKTRQVEILLEMEPYQILQLNKNGELQLLDRNRNFIREIDYTFTLPTLKKGTNVIIADAEFSEEGASNLKFEIRTEGPEELVKASETF
jgi:hypothetical protein